MTLPRVVNRQVQLFMTKQDEDDFFSAVRFAVPSIEVIDGQMWPTYSPPLKPSVSSCASNDVYLWSRATIPQLPSAPRPGGGYQGPTSGVVIQWLRNRFAETTILSGRLAVGTSQPKIAEFADRVWSVLRRTTTTDLVTLADDPAPDFKLGWMHTTGSCLTHRIVFESAARKPISFHVTGSNQ
jgi:hypothetical protein